MRRTWGSRASAGCVMVLLSVLLLAACRSTYSEDPETPPQPAPPTYLRVENQAFLDMTIYVYRSSQRIRLGTVTGNSRARFVIPASLIFGGTMLRFQADPIGGRRQPISQEITVDPGDEIELRIPPT